MGSTDPRQRGGLPELRALGIDHVQLVAAGVGPDARTGIPNNCMACHGGSGMAHAQQTLKRFWQSGARAQLLGYYGRKDLTATCGG